MKNKHCSPSSCSDDSRDAEPLLVEIKEVEKNVEKSATATTQLTATSVDQAGDEWDYTIKSPTRLTTVMVIESDNEDIIIQYSPMPDDNIASTSVCVKASDHDDDGDDNKTIPYKEEEDFESSHDDKKTR